jgi:hypothetical protein
MAAVKILTKQAIIVLSSMWRAKPIEVDPAARESRDGVIRDNGRGILIAHILSHDSNVRA